MRIPLISLAAIIACWLNAGFTISGDDKDPDLFKPESYYHDKELWKEWDELVSKYPEDRDLQPLHALRLGLCVKIDKGTIKLENAIDIFAHAHEEVARMAMEKRDKERPPAM